MKLFATDLDGTLVGDRQALLTLNQVLIQHRKDWHLIYVTGRSLELAQQLAEQEPLLLPDAWVTDVGTIITYANGQTDAIWEKTMQTGWNRQNVAKEAARIPELVPQPQSGQGPFKVSFHLKAEHAEHTLPHLKHCFELAGQHVKMIYSGNKYMDILPQSGDKGKAVCHLLDHFGIKLEELLTCGDSGNDLCMLCLGGAAVAVGNALPELLEDIPASVYRAKSSFAGGILEGLIHFGWLPS